MPAHAFKHLFTPLRIGNVTVKNRIFSTGHDTSMPTDGTVNDRLVAYHKARAEGGCGLIVMQVAGVHDSARYTSHILMATTDECIPGYRRVVEICRQHDCRIFGQLFHPGREIMESSDGSTPVAWAPSAVPNERFHVMPRPLTQRMIGAIVEGYGTAAGRLRTAGLEGVEIVASHAYLPSQFLNPRFNLREDGYGGSLENRLRFLREVIASIRRHVGNDFVVGLRISGDDRDQDGQKEGEALEAILSLEKNGGLDYYNVI
ncbi:MAG: hypothetical protein WEC00_08145, partial [Dongiaceae bacterium]